MTSNALVLRYAKSVSGRHDKTLGGAMHRPFRFLAAVLAACVVLGSAISMSLAHAQGEAGTSSQSRRTSHPSADTAVALSPQQRGALARRFVLKWGDHVRRVYGVPVGAWSARMVSTFAAADPANFRNALQRETFEGAIAELMGSGHRLSDAEAIARLTQASLTPAALSPGDLGAKTLGSTLNDLVFTPVQPCRVVDTRIAGGAIAANASRSFFAVVGNPGDNFVSQGGSNTNCGVAQVGASAVALNVTAVSPNAAGFATVYPHLTSAPLAASINYTAGAIVNNSVIVRIPNPLADRDFSIFTFAQSHYVVDIVGYFSPPEATALQCVLTNQVDAVIPVNGSATVLSAACPAGYTKVGNSCDTTSSFAYLTISGIGGCQARNTSGSIQNLSSIATCCRVPGR
jgi:hypothetical protein